MPTLVIFADSNDGQIEARNSIYATALAGTFFLTSSTSGTSYNIGRFHTTANGYSLFQAFMQFDTSTIGAGAFISTATLALSGTADNSDVNFTVEARLVDWDTSLTITDWVPGSSLNSYTRVATRSTVGWATAGYNTFTEDGNNFRNGVDRTGSTRLMLTSSNLNGAAPPSNTNEYVVAAATDAVGTSEDPKLTIKYFIGHRSPGATFTAGMAIS